MAQIIDRACFGCGTRPAEYRPWGARGEFRQTCVRCQDVEKDAARYHREAKAQASPFKILDRPCVKCGEQPSWYAKHPSAADGYRRDCVDCQQVYRVEYRQRPERQAVALPYHRAYSKVRGAQIKTEVFAHYGGICYCCGESDQRFLTLDHINNDGAAHRRETKAKGLMMYYWVKKNGYPLSFRLACFNCNCARQYRSDGVCPHEEERRLLLAA